MTQILAPLPPEDYRRMGCDHTVFSSLVSGLADTTRPFVIQATHRLTEVDWLTRTLEGQLRAGKGPPYREGLLSLQIYLLLTCADTLGHVCTSKTGAKVRYRAFFESLPHKTKKRLVDAFLVWKTNPSEMASLGLGNLATQRFNYPSHQQLVQFLLPLSFQERFEAFVDWLYARRNWYTHEAQFPMLGYHPNLSVLQGLRLALPNQAVLGELDRLQPLMDDKGRWYLVYFETDDPVDELRWAIVEGLGYLVGCSPPAQASSEVAA